MRDIDDLRMEIDLIDHEIFDLLRQRFACVHKIGVAKKISERIVTDADREKMLIDRAIEQTGFDRSFIEAFYQVIMEESKRRQ